MLWCCCNCHQILLWDTNCESYVALEVLQGIYEDNGICADLSSEYSGNLNDYSLIIWPAATSDPVWWGEITGETWIGRLHLTAEWYHPVLHAPTDYINGKTALHGMTVAHDFEPGTLNCVTPSTSTPASHQLTDGVTSLTHAASASISGGTDVFISDILSLPMMQQNKPSAIDWVLAGDSNHLIDFCPAMPPTNEQFLLNLFNKPL